LAAGKGCVLDGTFSKTAWRMRSRELALEMKIPFFLVYCECPERIVLERIARRTHDPSDATREIYLEMKNHFSPAERESIVVNTSRRLSMLIPPLLSKLGR
jgi:predicted kinase